MKKLWLMPLVLALTGCIGTTGQLIKIDPALLKDCPSTLPAVQDTSDTALLAREKSIVEQYSSCARNKNALNRAIRKLQSEE